jgi:hypothetical protein
MGLILLGFKNDDLLLLLLMIHEDNVPALRVLTHLVFGGGGGHFEILLLVNMRFLSPKTRRFSMLKYEWESVG